MSFCNYPCLYTCFLFLSTTLGSLAHPDHEIDISPQGSLLLASALLHNHPYLLDVGQREWLNGELQRSEKEQDGEISKERFHKLLESLEALPTVDLKHSNTSDSFPEASFRLPGDRGGLVFKVLNGAGPVSYNVVQLDLSKTEKMLTVPVASSGTTWALLSMNHVPDGITHVYVSLDSGLAASRILPIQLIAPQTGRFKVEILSDDTGQPTPAMVQLQWLFDGSTRPPGRHVDFTSQFDSQSRTRERIEGSRFISYPGMEPGHFWICSGPFDMSLPPGDWKITILRGLEHLAVVDTVSIKAGITTRKSYQPKRWVHMADRGWYSGDDHVHAQIQSDADAERLLVWAQAEDTHVLNILEMGDHERTFFQQRAFGKPSRIRIKDTILVPGQEDPRIAHLGHTIALNIGERVRNTSHYYLHDWVYDTVKEHGGLYGYAHINRGLFNIERDLSLNVPKGKVDFVEILQFHHLGTELYYHFLNLGEKMNASAGSDVPWGGTVGEVRVYANLGQSAFSADAWFKALEEGKTFVTNGPMLEFSVNDSFPGDQINVDQDTKRLRIKARAWGHADRLVPVRLEVVRLGEVIQTAKQTEAVSDELILDFEIEAGPGCWLAARVYADNGSVAHTTPVYVKRPSLRFWKHAEVPALVERSLKSLDELETLARNIANPSTMPTRTGTGSLVGAWYARPNLVRAKTMDFFDNSGNVWGNNRPRGRSWSARWQGRLTIPENHAPPDRLYLDSSGATTLTIDDQVVIHKRDRGKANSGVILQPGKAHKIVLTYNHLQSPIAYMHFSTSRKGAKVQTIPPEWFSFTEDDFRAAYRNALGSLEEQRTLGEQAPALIERIDDARQIYRDLSSLWESETSMRRPYLQDPKIAHPVKP